MEGYFAQELRMNLQTFSMLTTFQFLDSHNGHSTNLSAYINPTLFNAMKLSGKSPRTLEWRIVVPPSRAATLRMSNEDFIMLFFNIYKTMFKDIFHEGFDLSKAMAAMEDKLSKSHGQTHIHPFKRLSVF